MTFLLLLGCKTILLHITGKRCQALELPRESSGTFGAGSGWLLRLTTDQMRRERGG
jgi:hypothetical protein